MQTSRLLIVALLLIVTAHTDARTEESRATIPPGDSRAIPSGASAAVTERRAFSPTLDCGYRYVESAADLELRVTPLVSDAGCIDCGVPVVYTSFDGAQYNLTQFTGEHVAVLLPDSWMGPEGLTTEEIRVFVDRSDVHYQRYSELVGQEPPGAGPLTIAIVSQTCGWGCGYVGAKGVEILDADWSRDLVRDDLAEDQLDGVVIHEMNHNFDVFWQYLHYAEDHAHAWTAFMDEYARAHTRMGTKDTGPDEVLRDAVESRFGPYLNDPSANWADCVRDGICAGITPNLTWGGMTSAVAQLVGTGAMRDAFVFLQDFKQSQAPPAGAEGKEDLHIEALAAGAQLNLGCLVDAWSWHASSAARARMAGQYGTLNPLCEDVDHDRYRPLDGDCDDGALTIHPGALEAPNGIDDNCDGIIDEVLYVEPTGGDFPDPFTIDKPARLQGAISTVADADPFLFFVASPRTVRFTLQSKPDFQGWLFVHQQAGGWLDYQFVWEGSRSTHDYFLDASGLWRFSVELNVDSQPGGYEVLMRDKPEWPLAWGATSPPVWNDDSYRLTLDVLDLDGAILPPTEARFWVSGIGMVGSVPYAASTFVDWTPDQSIDQGTYGYRVELLADGLPVLDVTPPEWFQHGSAAVGEAPAPARAVMGLHAAPNPFNPHTEIRFELASGGPVRLAIYDVAGRLVAELVDAVADAGTHAIAWDGRNQAGTPIASGVYVAALETPSGTTTTPLVLAR